MIYDNMENLKGYDAVSENVLTFLNNLTIDIKTGKYMIDDNSYANVEIYNTKSSEGAYPEAHKKYIDIQTVLTGKEKIEFTDISNLRVKDDYDEGRDIMFYHNTKDTVNSVILTPGKFALLYPHEAHKPQLRIDSISSTVKKVVVKVRVH